ncbi:hypothetical protein [Bradyrhizobium sp. LA2.1]|uniref:hypothetical protein n=1 Tax=Bradyrhizobium sp. LA2.1 TaxID=3156376 RepID=UPI00339679B6
MIRDVTSELQSLLSSELGETIDALTTLNKHFGRETRSIALGEVSESLIAAYTGAVRSERNTKGHDLLKGELLIEVKARLIDRYQNTCQFNFRRHSARAHIAFCLAWCIDTNNRPLLEQVFEVEVPFLIATFAKPNQPLYCARTTLGALRREALDNRSIREAPISNRAV